MSGVEGKGDKMFLRSAFNYDVDAVSSETGLACLDPSLADQSQKDEVDINTIVHRFGVTGHLPFAAQDPVFADVSMALTAHEAMNEWIAARDAFNRLPSAVRRRFDNAADFVAFCSDRANQKEIDELGLGPIRENVEAPVEDKPEGA